MPHEIEMKFKVPSLPAVARRLRACGAKYLSTVVQDDTYFDTPSRRLLRAGRGLRLRSVCLLRRGRGAVDARALLTYKGPARKRAKAKVRPEHQSHVEDPRAIAEVLAGVGMPAAVRLQKRRASYRLARCLVELDELPMLGTFVEIEGPSEAAVQSARRKLKLDSPPIRSHYVQLALAACGKVGRRCRELTFANCLGCAGRRR